ncbi:MAG: acyl-CoA synthetase (NDP forming) [Oceanospirillaceae bacterium]|jgi:acyl-CoA synthetase (NDP forming)
MINKQRLRRLLAPKSIAVFGSRGANFAIRESLAMGFTGPIWSVHPKRDELMGIKCLKSALDLPQAPDAAYVAINAESAIETVAQLNKMGAGGALLYASGFSELGDELKAMGLERQQRLVEAAGDMPIIGPNCYGVINALDKAVLWPDQHGCQPVDKGVGIITQSGNIGLNMTMQKVGLPIAYMFTMGNQAQVDIATVIDSMLDDPRVTAIGLHIEGIPDLTAFDAAARRALSLKIPIVAIKTGRTAAAAKIALSHTSSLTGADNLFDALFNRLGIARVHTVPEFLETLKLLSLLGPLAHKNIASMSCSGGEAGMMADLIDGRNIVFGPLTPSQKQATLATFSNGEQVDNPLDYQTYMWNKRDQMAASFKAHMAANFSATLLILDWPNNATADPEEWDTALLALADAAQAGQHKAIVLASMAECMPPHAIAACIEHGMAPMIGMDQCLTALNHAYNIGQAFASPVPEPLQIRNVDAPGEEMPPLSEAQSKHALNQHGLPIPQGQTASNLEQVINVVTTLGYPITLKAVGADLAHKTELGAVKLNLKNQIQVEQAATALFALSNTLLVEQMVQGVVAELIIGINTDPLFGQYLVLGAGGIFVEILQDAQSLLLPTSKSEVRQALASLKCAPILTGYRGQAAADIDAIIDAVMAVLDYSQQNPVYELDINPLLAQSHGAVAVDALIQLGQ